MNFYYTMTLEKEDIPHYKEALINIAKTSPYPIPDFDKLPRLFVVFFKKEIVAYATVVCYHGHWVLRMCVVHPKHRGKGLQRSLIQARLLFLSNQGIKSVLTWVKPTNSYSLNNLIDLGFRFRNERPRIFDGMVHVKLYKNL
jgi:ribosomal protein S18 acetylase RimI-like enzyme